MLKSTYIPGHPNFHQTIRHLFSTSIASAFSKVLFANLSRWLDLPSAEDIKAWCESIGWEVQGDAAIIPKNGDNDVKAGVVKESVELSRELWFYTVNPAAICWRAWRLWVDPASEVAGRRGLLQIPR